MWYKDLIARARHGLHTLFLSVLIILPAQHAAFFKVTIAPLIPPSARVANTAETPHKSLGGREDVSLFHCADHGNQQLSLVPLMSSSNGVCSAGSLGAAVSVASTAQHPRASAQGVSENTPLQAYHASWTTACTQTICYDHNVCNCYRFSRCGIIHFP